VCVVIGGSQVTKGIMGGSSKTGSKAKTGKGVVDLSLSLSPLSSLSLSVFFQFLIKI